MQTNCKALAKIVLNKKLNTLRLLVTFDTTKKDKNGNIIITVQNAAFKSGDICSANENAEYIAYNMQRVIKQAKEQLRTNNIVVL